MTHKHVRSYRTNKFRVGSATRLVVRGIVVKLASSAFVDWAFVDENQKEYESGNTQLTGEDYQAWGDDDEYLGHLNKLKNNHKIVDRYFVKPDGTNNFKKTQ